GSSSTVAEICSAKRRNLCPSDTTRKLLRWRQRCNKVWNVERNPWRTVADRPISLSGSLLRAWRRQKPRRALGNSVRILLTVLSKPSVRAPFTRYDGSCSRAACWHWAEDAVKAAALLASLYPRCQS